MVKKTVAEPGARRCLASDFQTRTFAGAALAIWLEKVPANFFHLVLDVAFLLFLISCGICLAIVGLHWASTAELRASRGFVAPSGFANRPVPLGMAPRSVVAVGVTALATVYHLFETLFSVYFNWRWDLSPDPDTGMFPGF